MVDFYGVSIIKTNACLQPESVGLKDDEAPSSSSLHQAPVHPGPSTSSTFVLDVERVAFFTKEPDLFLAHPPLGRSPASGARIPRRPGMAWWRPRGGDKRRSLLCQRSLESPEYHLPPVGSMVFHVCREAADEPTDT